MGLTKSKWMATMVGNWNPSNFLLGSSRELSFDSLHHQLNLHPRLDLVNIQGTDQSPATDQAPFSDLVRIASSHLVTGQAFISSWFTVLKPWIAGFLSMLIIISSMVQWTNGFDNSAIILLSILAKCRLRF
jgi:hypothetical protein